MKEFIKRYMQANSREIIIFLSIMLIGILVGIGGYNLLNSDSKANLYNLCNEFLEAIKSENFAGMEIFINSLSNNILLVLLLVFASLTIISFQVVSIILFVKGLSIGFFVAIIFSIFGAYKGMLYTLILVLIPNLLYIPIITIISIVATSFSYKLMYMSKLDKKWLEILKHTFKMVALSISFIVPIILESYIIKIFVFTYLNIG